MLTTDMGKHLQGVEDLLQRLSLLESDLAAVGNRVQAASAAAQPFMQSTDEQGTSAPIHDTTLQEDEIQPRYTTTRDYFFWNRALTKTFLEKQFENMGLTWVEHQIRFQINILLIHMNSLLPPLCVAVASVASLRVATLVGGMVVPLMHCRCYQYTGINFADLGRMTGRVNPTWY